MAFFLQIILRLAEREKTLLPGIDRYFKQNATGDYIMIRNRAVTYLINLPDIFKFLMLISITLWVTYYATAPFRTIWYVILLVFYFYSKNEALWLAFYLATVDGFVGFFGLYSATLELIPDLPSIELAQLYILLSVFKASRRNVRVDIFYLKFIQLMLIYVIFLVAWGQVMGLTGDLNVYFRVIKGILPLFLFYSIPRLFTDENTYERFFRIIFVIVLFAFGTQIFTLITGIIPMTGDVLENEEEKRVYYNASSTILGLFGALYFLTARRYKGLMLIMLYAVIIAAMGMAVLSSTRGWIISFGLIIIATLFLTRSVRRKHLIPFSLIFIPLLYLGLSNSSLNEQINFSQDRLSKMRAIATGDLTAGGTLQRLDVRSERVMSGWRESPVFGWGFSDNGYRYADGHVGNQSLLAFSGLTGFILLNSFLIFFAVRIFLLRKALAINRMRQDVFLIFIFFLVGWFIIHSSSGQQFGFFGLPSQLIPLSVFFSFGAFEYSKFKSRINVRKI
jgi:hypothetical protein